LGFSDNSTELLIPKGTTVPCQHRTKALTTHDLNREKLQEVMHIPLLQGENEHADQNREIGTLKISGDQVSRALPANSDVELLIEVDSSFHVKVKAFIPRLGQTFDNVLPGTLAPLPDCAVMEGELAAEVKRAEEAVRNAEAKDIKVEEADVHEVQRKVGEIKEQLQKAKADDPDAAERTRRAIEQLRVDIDRLESDQRWPSLLRHLEEVKAFATEAADNSNDQKDADRVAKLLKDVETTVRFKNDEKLEKQIASLESLAWTILSRRDDFWVGSFQSVARHSAEFVDQQRGNALLEEGTLAIERGDYESLRTIVRELWGLVPETADTSKEKMRFPSSLRKRSLGYL
jgi:molecular chaperone DnaK